MREAMKEYLEFFNYDKKVDADPGYSTANSTLGNLKEDS